MSKIAILGATGPTGIHLAAALRGTGASVRVVARTDARLQELFPDTAIEKLPADVLDADATLRAIEDCDLVYDCIGLPGDQMHLHPVTARNIAHALRQTNARCIQVSSYWAYYPQVRAVMDESHPRTDGPPWVRFRREAEDILAARGAAVLHLPDFYGPQVNVSSLQGALAEAVAGKTMNWLGSAGVAREYIYVPDAMRIAVAIGAHPGVSGGHWCVAGAGPLTGRMLADIASRHLHRAVRLRAAPLWMLRLFGLFNRELGGFMQVAPNYLNPVSYDARKLVKLLGPLEMTGYESGVSQTLDWIAAAKH
jgi:nucleoside-diphosphate-sugar epimerase